MATSYNPYYSGGWQSGEEGGTPITPDALNHMDQGIVDVDAKVQYLNIGSIDMLSAIVNALSDGQMCYFRTTSTTTNQPSSGMYMIGHAIRGGTNNITIQASEMSVPSVVYQNSTTDGGSTWNGWSRIYTVPKTVPTTDDLDNYRGANYSGTYNLNGQVTNAPSAYGALLVIGNYQVCIAKNNLYFRGYSGNPASWGSWHNVSFT